MGYTERLLKRGFWQHGLVKLLGTLVTNLNATLLKLDADGTVADTNYSASAITSPSIGTITTQANKEIKPNGMTDYDAVSVCLQLRTNLNTVLDKLAADAGVNGTTAYTALKFASTDFPIETGNAKVKLQGYDQDALVEFLDAYLAKFNALLLVLDADSGVSDTDYASLWFVGDVVENSSSSSSCRSSSSCSSSSSCRSSSSSSSRSSSSSCSSSSCSSSSSSRSSSSSSRSSSSSSSSCRSSSSSSSSRSSSSSSSSSVSSSSSSSRSSSSSCSSSSNSSSSSSRSSSSSCRSSSSSCSSRSSSSSSSSCRSSSSSSSSSQAIS